MISKRILQLLNRLFDTKAAGLYILVFAASIGIATFIENDYGTSSAQNVVFKTWWFELLLLLFCITLIVNIVRFRMIPQKKWALFIFHSAMIVILFGAGVTRYFGYEGMIHIRENEAVSKFLTAETYLKYEVIDRGNKYQFDEQVLFSTLGSTTITESYLIKGNLLEVKVNDFIPNPIQSLESSQDGKPILKIVIGGIGGREEYFISPGEVKKIRNRIFNFTEEFNPRALNIKYQNKKLLIKSNNSMTQMVMATQKRDTLLPREEFYPLMLKSLYTDPDINFVFGDFNEAGKVQVLSEDRKVKNESLTALKMEVAINGDKKKTIIYGKKGQLGRPSILKFGDVRIAISYGAKYINLPFSIKLHKFIMARYPGTNSAASYASEVQLIDTRSDVKLDYRIFMNNILDHDGYRFFQSSFDKDEKGTYLSVNHDFMGTWISYLGYALLTIGLIMIFFTSRSRFRQVTKKLGSVNTPLLWIIICMHISILASGQKVISPNVTSITKDHAAIFSNVIVQDHKGRMKPMHTLSREVLRKIMRKETLNGLNADQIILSMYADKDEWKSIPMIKISKDEKLKKILISNGNYVSFKDFFLPNGQYKLREEVRRAYGLQPIDRGTYEKDIMKIDERVNIANMIYSGRLFKIIPIPDDPNNEWVSSEIKHRTQSKNIPVADKFFAAYKPTLKDALNSQNYTLPDKIIEELIKYQNSKGGSVMPSKTQIVAEITLNKLNAFSRLSLYYSVLGLCFLALLFITVFRPHLKVKRIIKILLGLVVLGFIVHTIGLGIRWYVSERAPWSNGYESMIYIAWTTTLAGIIFTRKSLGGLAATMILAGTILLVAMLSYLDPEITPLVPVLRSYWLTIHVSLIAGSYGFLMLGAIIGIINLTLMIFLTKDNKNRVHQIIQEMTDISELTITGGLIMICIGTYLGGVWANESWGRYWGWDAKETWALVTILVYAFILHMRIIPRLYSLYSFNLASLFGFASVAMTYFGVNYYLSGLHSYAAGDPVPIPSWVYIAVLSVTIVSVLAFWRKRSIV